MNGMLGSIDANQGDMLLGWDTDEFPFNVYDTTLCMYEVLKAGGMKHGGFNFDAKNRRPSNTREDMVHGFILGMDTFALGLLKAAEMIEKGTLDSFIAERYASFNDGIGKKILEGQTSLAELSAYACEKKTCEVPASGRQEYLEGLMNQVLFR